MSDLKEVRAVIQRIEETVAELEGESDKPYSPRRKACGALLKEFRALLGITLEELAGILDVKLDTARRYETGELKLTDERAKRLLAFERRRPTTGPEMAIRQRSYLMDLFRIAEKVYLGKSMYPFLAADRPEVTKRIIECMESGTAFHYVYPIFDDTVGPDLAVAKESFEDFRDFVKHHKPDLIKDHLLVDLGIRVESVDRNQAQLLQAIGNFASWIVIEYKPDDVVLLNRRADVFVELPIRLTESMSDKVDDRKDEIISAMEDTLIYAEVPSNIGWKWWKRYSAALQPLIPKKGENE